MQRRGMWKAQFACTPFIHSSIRSLFRTCKSLPLRLISKWPRWMQLQMNAAPDECSSKVGQMWNGLDLLPIHPSFIHSFIHLFIRPSLHHFGLTQICNCFRPASGADECSSEVKEAQFTHACVFISLLSSFFVFPSFSSFYPFRLFCSLLFFFSFSVVMTIFVFLFQSY